MVEPIYLDYNATTPLLPEVKEAIIGALKLWGNPSSKYSKGVEAKSAIEASREKIATLLHCKASEIVFMSGGTEANNQVINTIVKEFQGTPHFVTSSIEHDATLNPLKDLESSGLIKVTYVSPNPETGFVEPETVAEACKDNTRLVSIMLANNETGVLQPVKEIVERVKARNKHVLFHTDAAQALGKVNVDFQQLSVDYLTVVGHKFYGPRIGALVRKTSAPLHPLLFGGGQEKSLRPGTENTPMIVGLGVAAESAKNHLEETEKQLRTLRDRLETQLKGRLKPGEVEVHFAQSPRLPNTSSLCFPASSLLGQEMLAQASRIFEASTGAACHSNKTRASKILLASGISEEKAARTLRISVGKMTSSSDIDTVVEFLASNPR